MSGDADWVRLGATDGTPVFVDPRTITPKNIEWDDFPFLPRGELVTNNADGDTGKGLLAVHYAARTSRGEFPGPRLALFITAEDRWDAVLVPRLIAAGADFDHVRLLRWMNDEQEGQLVIPDDVPVLEEHLAPLAPRLVIVDPLLTHLSGRTSYSNDHHVKRALGPLMQLAHRLGCTVLCNGHFTKNRESGARLASQGSTAFINTPRVAWAMAYDDNDPTVRVVGVIKSNIGPSGISRSYRIQPVIVEGLEMPVPVLDAVGPSLKTVDDLIKNGRVNPEQVAALREMVIEMLADGERPRNDLNAAAIALGATRDMLYKNALVPLRDEGAIRARKDGFDGRWFWYSTGQNLPPPHTPPPSINQAKLESSSFAGENGLQMNFAVQSSDDQTTLPTSQTNFAAGKVGTGIPPNFWEVKGDATDV